MGITFECTVKHIPKDVAHEKTNKITTQQSIITTTCSEPGDLPKFLNINKFALLRINHHIHHRTVTLKILMEDINSFSCTISETVLLSAFTTANENHNHNHIFLENLLKFDKIQINCTCPKNYLSVLLTNWNMQIDRGYRDTTLEDELQ